MPAPYTVRRRLAAPAAHTRAKVTGVDTHLRVLSPPVARLLDASPRRARYLEHAPDVTVLDKIAGRDEPAARRAIRELRGRCFIHLAAQESEGASPLWCAARWAALADACVRLADRAAWHAVVSRLGPLDDEMVPDRAVIALGKLGGEELNPSSDIDLLCINRSDRGMAGGKTAHEVFERWVKSLRGILSDVDENGFGFRVDLDLRPEGRAGPLVNSIDAAERYYETFGQAWEQIALLRARAVVDVGGVGTELLQRLSPFCFPRSPSPAIVDAIGGMRARVAATAAAEGLDIKRAGGGIRDIEFMVQVHQHLYARRRPDLQVRPIEEAIVALERSGHLSASAARTLDDGYRFWRRVEHALHWLTDQQSHVLPDAGDLRERVLVFLRGAEPQLTAAAFAARIDEVRAEVEQLADDFFGEVVQGRGDAELALDVTASEEVRKAALFRLGFADPAAALTQILRLARGRGSPFARYNRRRDPAVGERATTLLLQLGKSPHPDLALSRLSDLVPAVAHPKVWARIADDETVTRRVLRVLSLSGPLTKVAARAPLALLEALRRPDVRRRAKASWLRELSTGGDDEQFADEMRTQRRDLLLRLGMGFIDGRLSVFAVARHLSTFADACLEAALARAKTHAHRRVPGYEGAAIAVTGLGALGGRELSVSSDLDLLFVYDDADGGDAGLSEWAARLARRLIWLLSAKLPTGAGFEVDTRLRPSGNQGSLCVSHNAFVSYHESASALWERQSLLRLRRVAGDDALARRVESVARSASLRGGEPAVGMRLLDMRDRMVKERARSAGFHLKQGEGGLADIEFAVQGLQLWHGPELPWLYCPSTPRALLRLMRRGVLDEENGQVLFDAYALLGTVRTALLLLDDVPDAVVRRDDDRMDEVARMLRHRTEFASSGEALTQALFETAADVRERTFRILLRLA